MQLVLASHVTCTAGKTLLRVNLVISVCSSSAPMTLAPNLRAVSLCLWPLPNQRMPELCNCFASDQMFKRMKARTMAAHNRTVDVRQADARPAATHRSRPLPALAGGLASNSKGCASWPAWLGGQQPLPLPACPGVSPSRLLLGQVSKSGLGPLLQLLQILGLRSIEQEKNETSTCIHGHAHVS